MPDAGRARPLLFAIPLPDAFERRTVHLDPGIELAFDAADWHDAVVLVESGELELRCTRGGRRRFPAGSVLALEGLSLRALRNPGIRTVELVSVSRRRSPQDARPMNSDPGPGPTHMITETTPPDPDRTRWTALYVLCAGVLMIVLDVTIVNVALPTIQDDLGFSASGLAWVVNGYLIAFGGLLLLAGRLGDLIGRRTVFLAGLAVFVVASAAVVLKIAGGRISGINTFLDTQSLFGLFGLPEHLPA